MTIEEFKELFEKVSHHIPSYKLIFSIDDGTLFIHSDIMCFNIQISSDPNKFNVFILEIIHDPDHQNTFNLIGPRLDSNQVIELIYWHLFINDVRAAIEIISR